MAYPNLLTAVTAAALFFVLQLACNTVAAQDCSTITECGSCLDESCNWWAAAQSCISTCGIIAETSCYSLQEDETSAVTCERAANSDADLTICDDYTDCSSCVGQILSDGTSTCQWYPSVDGSASYCSSTCDSDECGVTECPPCSVNTECGGCLYSSCAWATDLGCVDSCSETADVGCFTLDTEGTSTARASAVEEICTVAGNQQADAALCSGLTDCTTCVATVLSDDTTTCQWFDNNGSTYCASACGMDGCGSTTCSAPETTSAPTETPAAAAGSTSLVVTGLLLGYSGLVFVF
jgi:hypothetical protein